MEILLSIDTCGTAGSVALGRVERTPGEDPGMEILQCVSLSARSASAELTPKLGEMLSQVHASVRNLGAIVVVHGPGSFTGIRVGVSAAKGLSQSAGIPLIAVSRLQLLAQAAGSPHVIAALEAGRGEFYAGEYQNGGLRESLFTAAELRNAASQAGAGRLVFGREPGSASLPEIFAACRAAVLATPDAGDALRFALPRYLSRDFEQVDTLDGHYLRRTGAELFGIPDRRPNVRPESA